MRASQGEPVDPFPRFRVARNPDPESRLPYLIWLPIEGGLVLKAREDLAAGQPSLLCTRRDWLG